MGSAVPELEPMTKPCSEEIARSTVLLKFQPPSQAAKEMNLETGILLYCDMMKAKLAPTNPLAPKIEEIRFAAEQGAGLIRQLMTVGREEKDAPRWVSFNHALREIVPLLRHLAGEHIAITMELAAGAPRVGLSLAEAQQLILNLVLNARDAMPAGGRVRLETRLDELEDVRHGKCALVFSVSDSG